MTTPKKPRIPGNLDFLMPGGLNKIGGKEIEEVELPPAVKQVEDAIARIPKHIVLTSKAEIAAKYPKEVEEVKQTDKVELVRLNIVVEADLMARIHSETFHDSDKRPLYEVLQEILWEGLKARPYKGPASPTFIERLKRRGWRAKKDS